MGSIGSNTSLLPALLVEKIEREEESRGYGSWLRSDEDLDNENITSLTQLGEEIERKKQKVRALALTMYNGVDDITANYIGASNLTGDAPVSFGSDLFSSLQYEDLRKAHTETVVPVTFEDYNNVKKFNNVNEYNTYRNNHNNNISFTTKSAFANCGIIHFRNAPSYVRSIMKIKSPILTFF